MSERSTITAPGEKKLWYDGPNYAADAVIIDPDMAKILLIERADTGEWALPGGFIDPTGESSLEAALREAKEEAGVSGLSGGECIYRGRTSDRRSTTSAWIETSAHLFHLPSTGDIQAGDDAKAAAWHTLDNLPALYGAHRMLVERALDYIENEQLFALLDDTDQRTSVNGGYMRYDKYIAEKDDQLVFVKQQPDRNVVNPGRYTEMACYLQKEASIMAHLRLQGYRHVPEKSAFREEQLAMNAFRTEDGWQWQANKEAFDTYMEDTLAALAALESSPLPTDVFDVEPSYESLLREGWQMLDEEAAAKLPSLLAEIPPTKLPGTYSLLHDIPALKQAADTFDDPKEFVFCHHDMRQENLAWHPVKGVKIIDWSWAGPGLPGSDATSLLIDLHKSGHDVSKYLGCLNQQHCLNLMGFWLAHSTLPNQGAEGLRAQQFASALSAYELLLASGVKQ